MNGVCWVWKGNECGFGMVLVEGIGRVECYVWGLEEVKV